MSGGVTSAEWRAAHPHDVCPACGRHAEWEKPKSPYAYIRPVVCSECGATVRWCDVRYLTPDERAGMDDRKRARARERWAEKKDELNARRRAASQTDEARARRREYLRKRREAMTPEQLEAEREKKRRYYREHRDEARERMKTYRLEHGEEIYLRQKRWKMERLRREKEEPDGREA